MPDDASPFLLPPASPPERRTALRVILGLSAIAHVALLAVFSRSPPEPPRPPPADETVRVLRGEVSADAAEPGLRLFGYAQVAAPVPAKR